jgi:hypothetical protein
MMVKNKLFAKSALGGCGHAVRARRKRGRHPVEGEFPHVHFDLLKTRNYASTVPGAITQPGESFNAEIAARDCHDSRYWSVCWVGHYANASAAD